MMEFLVWLLSVVLVTAVVWVVLDAQAVKRFLLWLILVVVIWPIDVRAMIGVLFVVVAVIIWDVLDARQFKSKDKKMELGRG